MGNLVTCVGMYDGQTLWRHKNLPSHARRHLSVMRLDDSQDLPETLEAPEPQATPEPATQEPPVRFLQLSL